MKIDYKRIEKDGKALVERMSRPSTSLSEKINKYRTLAHMKKEIEEAMALLKPDLIEANVNEMFPEDKEKIFVQPGAMQTKINPIKVYDEMVRRNRGREFFSICTVSATSLGKVDDGKTLVEMFKEETTRKAPSLKVSKMTKKDLEESAK